MKNLLLFLVTIIATTYSHAGPIIIGNGGGSAEFYIYYSKIQAQSWLRLCSSNPACAQGLESEIQTLIQSKSTQSEIILRTKKEMGEIAWSTLPRPESQITVNQDLLWKNEDGRLVAFELSDVLATLISAWSYQAGISDLRSNELGLRITSLVATEVLRTPWSESFRQNILAVQFINEPDLILIQDRSNAVNAMSREIRISEVLSCASATSAADVLRVTKINQVTWLQSFKSPKGETFASLGTKIQFTCSGATGSHSFSARIKLLIPVSRVNDVFSLTKGDIRTLIQGIESQF